MIIDSILYQGRHHIATQHLNMFVFKSPIIPISDICLVEHKTSVKEKHFILHNGDDDPLG